MNSLASQERLRTTGDLFAEQVVSVLLIYLFKSEIIQVSVILSYFQKMDEKNLFICQINKMLFFLSLF